MRSLVGKVESRARKPWLIWKMIRKMERKGIRRE
jgi:hypothetical protein